MPRPLDQVLRRLLIFRLFVPLALALVGINCISAWLVWQSYMRQAENEVVSISLRIQDQFQSASQALNAAAELDPGLSGEANNLSLVRRAYPRFLGLYVLDPNG